MSIDLHCHTSASDGSLTPAELAARAAQNRVSCLAITDHDTLGGCDEILSMENLPFEVITGIEFSGKWKNRHIHIIGLNFDPHSGLLRHSVELQTDIRIDRAKRIADKLSHLGIKDLYEKAAACAGQGVIGRPHFAQVLIDCGFAKSNHDAFKRFLGDKRPANVKIEWPLFNTIINWIVQAGGVAVLAHPLRYRLSRKQIDELVADFKAAGGSAIEVMCGKQTREVTTSLSDLAKRHDMYASLGSDFHHPDMPWADLGCAGDLPLQCEPVWKLWQ